MNEGIETLEFQAEARQLLQLVIHSIYSNKDIFLRELISNAADALDKLRLESFRDKELQADLTDLHIEIDIDKPNRLLTVRDNGIGMSRDEVVQLIGTIARSGTAELLAKMKEANDSAASKELIGQFGVGFYSSFMVADKVTLLSRRPGETEATRWSSTGEGSYTIESVAEAPTGTSVTLHLKAADDEDQLFDYTSDRKIKEIVKRYSDFIPWPITMAVDPIEAKPIEAKPVDGEIDAESVDAESVGAEAAAPQTQTLNSMKALWARAKDDVKPDEYNEFYRHISHDWTDPLEVIHMRGEGTFEYEALLFVPARAPFDLFRHGGKRGVQLYVKRVFIMDDCEALMPEYLRFVKGVVDAHDLSLNVSREILQQDRQIQLIRRRLVKKVLATVKDMMSDNAERYATFWGEFGRAVKEGLLDDPDNREAILEISSFASTHVAAHDDSTNDDSAHNEKVTNLRDYVLRMKDGQEHIYFMTGDSRTTIENSPHLEAFRAKGYEVLLLTDPVDEVWVDVVTEFDGKRLQSVAKGQVDLDTEDEKKTAEPGREQQQKDFAALLAWMATTLKDDVKDVRISTRLTTSPACIVGDADDVTPALARMYQAMGQELPPMKRVLEVNPTHPLIVGLQKAHGEREGDETLAETVELLFGTALLAEGGQLTDPAHFARLLANRLARAL